MGQLAPNRVFLGPTPPGYHARIVDASGTVVGDDVDTISLDPITLFADASDDTYIEHWRASLDVAPSGSGFAELQPVLGAVVGDYPLSMRAIMHDEGTASEWSTRIAFDVYDLENGNWLGWFSHDYAFGVQVPSVDVIHTITDIHFVPNSTANGGNAEYTLADLNDALQHRGLNLNLGAFIGTGETGATRMLRIYELTFGTLARLTPLRRFPVDNGAHGPRRLYPPPKSRRAGGGYH